MLIELKETLIDIDEWKHIYNKVRRKEISYELFGYGIKVPIKYLSKKLDLPLYPYFFFLISNKKNREFPIHIDGILGKQSASLNWGLEGCDENSPTEFYISKKEIIWKNLDNSFFMQNVEDAILTHKNTIHNGKGYLFRSDLLHRGFSNVNKRIIVKWELEYNEWNTACRELRNRNYI
jgi:hypothetical protein